MTSELRVYWGRFEDSYQRRVQNPTVSEIAFTRGLTPDQRLGLSAISWKYFMDGLRESMRLKEWETPIGAYERAASKPTVFEETMVPELTSPQVRRLQGVAKSYFAAGIKEYADTVREKGINHARSAMKLYLEGLALGEI